MISPRMRRPLRVSLLTISIAAIAAFATGCGTQKISVPKSDPQLYHGAVLFNQRCGGCHTLSYAATHGSASNVRTAQLNNGPNFDVRCERVQGGSGVDRVLYAIENGGFSGVIMPQNVVTGQDAIDVAEFVATYAGRQAPKIPGVPLCGTLPVGTVTAYKSIPATTATTAQTATTPSSTTAKHKTAAKSKTKHT
jgi:mono/diheme cytochrome c family protein